MYDSAPVNYRIDRVYARITNKSGGVNTNWSWSYDGNDSGFQESINYSNSDAEFTIDSVNPHYFTMSFRGDINPAGVNSLDVQFEIRTETF